MRRKAARVTLPTPDRSWMARDDMRTLAQAEEIRADRRRLAAAQKEAGKEAAKLSRITRKGRR